MITTWEQVLEIRRKYALSKPERPTQWDLAEEYGISQPQVSLIVNNRVYKTPEDLPLPPYAAPIDHPQTETLVEMYTSNIPTAEILQTLRMSSTTMYRLLRGMLIPLRNTKGGVAPIDHPQAETLADMYLSDVPIVVIQRDLHMSPTTMYHLLREMDIPLRNKKRKEQAPRKAAYLR